MNRPRICAVIVNDDPRSLGEVEPLVDLFEVRIDLIGPGWRDVARRLGRPWIACNRRREEGGGWRGGETERISQLLSAIDTGASLVDVELMTEGLEGVVARIEKRAGCLISYHDLEGTPPAETMKDIINRQLAAGADICKLVTTATGFQDNLSVLQLISDFAPARVVAFAMGALGLTSRVLCPLVGGDFTYASVGVGRESAPGQMTAADLTKVYRMLSNGR
ncbi:MAG: type I 3-dehydroquinate dehydratase [Chloroflexi bacterium]|nr:type I 3-dehydroquinate dehydratase [Chloroflexota bacterium]